MKKKIAVALTVAFLVSMFAVAFADSFYLRYVSNTRWYKTNSTSTRGSGSAKISQQTNRNTEDGSSGGRVRYGANTTNSTSNNYFTASNTTTAGEVKTIYPSVSSSVNAGATMYLNLKAMRAPSIGQWEISGNWHG